MNFFKQKTHIIILLAALAISGGMFLYGKRIYNDLLQLRESEIAFFTKSRELDTYFRDFQRSLGFGGFIHNVKEYIVHRSPPQLVLLDANVQELETAHAFIKEHLQDPESAHAMVMLDRFVLVIRQKHEQLIKPENQLLGPTELDILLDIETPEILSALVTLESLKNRHSKEAILKIQNSIDTFVSHLFLAIVLLPLTLLIGIYLTLLLNREIRTKQQLASATKLLRNNEEKFRALFEQAGGYCMIIDPNTSDGIPVIVDANKAACFAHGYTKEEFVGIPVANIDDEEGKRLVKKRTSEIMTGKPFYCENVHVRKDGTSFDVAVNAKRIDIGDEPPLILTTEYDITDRKNSEETIKTAYSMLKTAEEIAHIGSWEWDIQKDKFNMSEEWRQIHGVTNKILTMTELMSIAHPDDAKDIENIFKDALAGVRPYDLTHRIIRQDNGKVRVISAKGLVSRDKEGKPYKVIGTAQDITEIKLAEEELKESEERFRGVFNQAAVGVARLALDGTWLEVNKKLCDIVGYSHEELLSKTFKDITHPDDLQTDLNYVNQLLKDEIKTYTMEKRYLKKNGDMVWINLTASLTRDINNAPDYFVAVIEDITKRKQTERQLENYREQLESLVEQRTSELQDKIDELELFNTFTVDREEQMILLKEEINSLLSELEREEKYTVVK